MLAPRLRPIAPVLVVALLAGFAPAAAYAPGSGTVYSVDFEDELDEDWEMGNGLGQPSPWTRELDGGDKLNEPNHGTRPFSWVGPDGSPRSLEADFLRVEIDPSDGAVTSLAGEEDVTSYDDPVLGDGRTWFYLAR